MGRSDALRDKIQKLGTKQKLGALVKFADNPDDDVRMAVAIEWASSLPMIPAWLLSRFFVMFHLKYVPLPLLLLPTFTLSIAKSMLRSSHLPILIPTSDRLQRSLSISSRIQ